MLSQAQLLHASARSFPFLPLRLCSGHVQAARAQPPTRLCVSSHLPAGGEVDVRGCYCALAACEMLLLDKAAVGEACGMIDYIRHCQVRAPGHAFRVMPAELSASGTDRDCEQVVSRAESGLWHSTKGGVAARCCCTQQVGGQAGRWRVELKEAAAVCLPCVDGLELLNQQPPYLLCGAAPACVTCMQSHEGGIGGEPWNEAHGGYTFCGLAAAVLLGKVGVAATATFDTLLPSSRVAMRYLGCPSIVLLLSSSMVAVLDV